MHDIFEAAARRHPDRIAVESSGGAMTYAELGDRADRLASHLQALGVRPDDRVGICLDRSVEQVTATLAALKAGAAYVPLDPAYPADRLSFMVDDSELSLLVTEERLMTAVPAGSARRVLLDSERDQIDRALPARRPASHHLDQLAYVLYTSGSTGRPKGVAMTHRALANLLEHQLRSSPEGLRTLQFAALSFDVSFQEMFSTWASGGTLVLTDEETRRDPAALLEFLGRRAIERLFLPFVALQQLAEADPEPAAEHLALREVITAGEQLVSSAAVRRWFSPGTSGRPAPALVNQYGPTETHVCTAHDLAGPSMEWPELPPIGQALVGVSVSLLDQSARPTANGAAGELCVGGLAPARGYLRRPALTAERFVPDASSTVPGARLYRTGDLARWRDDGALEFLGRIDQQIKIRGFRVEPAEIEHVLLAHPSVEQAAVVARKEGSRAVQLVAYVVPSAADVDRASLRSHLSVYLPDHMIPAAFVRLAAMPLTPSGKIDRKALPAPTSQDFERAEFVAPRSPVEQSLAEIWSELLGVERVGVNDDFFRLGGNSLLAARVAARAQGRGIKLSSTSIFRHPSVAALAASVTSAPGAGDVARVPGEIPKVSRNEPLDLSSAQERLWFFDRLVPQSPLYNVPFAYQLHGPLEVAALERSLQEIVARHESLRTTFPVRDGRPVQKIAPGLTIEVPRVDLRDVTPADRSAEAMRLAHVEAGRPFDLERGPLIRARLLVLDSEEHVLIVVIHHIVTDGWSMEVLLGELAALYRGMSEGRDPGLPPPAIQYADYASWQRRDLAGDVLDEHLRYWKEKLHGAPQLHQLPTDRPRPTVASYRGARLPFELPASLTARLKDLGLDQSTTPFMTLLAGFFALLHRYSHEEDILVGAAVANRRVETEEQIGFFVNSIVMRGELSGNPSFRQLLGRVREAALGAYAHQDLPFERLVEHLNPERNPGHHPLFQIMFVLQNAPPIPRVGTIEPEIVELDSGTAKFDLTLSIEEHRDQLRGFIEYSTDLFDRATIDRMVGHFASLLEGAVADPDRPISALPLLDQAERDALSRDWKSTERQLESAFVHEQIEAQVDRTPDAIAVISGDESLTYRELDARANRLAHHLVGAGAGPERSVAIVLERSLDLVVSLLAVLKAGAAFVPIDPAYPRERAKAILEDSRAALAIAHSTWSHHLEHSGVRAIWLDLERDAVSARPSSRPEVALHPENLAYVLFTSGSTGRPKGVMCTHAGLRNLIGWMQQDFAVDANDVVLLKTPFTFDVSVWEFFGPFVAGSRLVVATPDGHRDPGYLARVIREAGVTTIQFVPSMLDVFLQFSDRTTWASVRQLFCAGEALSRQLEARFFEQSNALLANLYGPTEAVIYATEWRCRPEERPIVPIGRPVANTPGYILDRNLEPVPAGVSGELYLGGVQVARGYLGRPDLTAERFVPDPHGGAGGRLYRTGDLVRHRGDGAIEYLGRLDHQVKVRGFRIELGEIEKVLLAHPAVSQCVVVARGAGRDKRLVAYVVASSDAPDMATVRSHLAEHLPDYMVPAAFVVLDEMPLTPSGKVDRKALPEPSESSYERPDYAAPGTDLEDAIAQIWAEVLGVERVGVHDRFFAIGGNSLMAIQVHALLKQRLGLECRLVDLFSYPTVALSARFLTSDQTRRPEPIGLDRQRVEERRRSQAEQRRRRAPGPRSPKDPA